MEQEIVLMEVADQFASFMTVALSTKSRYLHVYVVGSDDHVSVQMADVSPTSLIVTAIVPMVTFVVSMAPAKQNAPWYDIVNFFF